MINTILMVIAVKAKNNSVNTTKQKIMQPFVIFLIVYIIGAMLAVFLLEKIFDRFYWDDYEELIPIIGMLSWVAALIAIIYIPCDKELFKKLYKRK